MVKLDPVFLEKKWYAVHTRSHHEHKVTGLIAAKGIETFLPFSIFAASRRSEILEFVHEPINA